MTSAAKTGNKSYDADLEAAYAYVRTAFQAFYQDHPEIFWINWEIRLRMVTVTTRQGPQAISETYVFFVLADTDGFTLRDARYPNQDKIEAEARRMEEAVETILQTVTATTPHEQVAQLNRWLTEHNEYNTSENLENLPSWPHECLSALAGSTGTEGPICDGYSRAFKILCELVTMLWRTQGSPEAEADLSRFADSGSVSGWALGAMRWAASTGLLEGSGGRLNPAGRAVRAEVAAILTRFCKAQ